MTFTIRMMLESLGYRVEHAVTARQALTKLESGKQVDLVLSDIALPGEMNGITFARLLRERAPQLPVVLTTAFSAAAQDAAAEGFPLLLKPYPLEVLADTLGKILPNSPQ
jgi:CheY-like chemotaxis protein